MRTRPRWPWWTRCQGLDNSGLGRQGARRGEAWRQGGGGTRQRGGLVQLLKLLPRPPVGAPEALDRAPRPPGGQEGGGAPLEAGAWHGKAEEGAWLGEQGLSALEEVLKLVPGATGRHARTRGAGQPRSIGVPLQGEVDLNAAAKVVSQTPESPQTHVEATRVKVAGLPCSQCLHWGWLCPGAGCALLPLCLVPMSGTHL